MAGNFSGDNRLISALAAVHPQKAAELRDIDSSAEMQESAAANMTKASKSEADKAEGYAKKYFPDAKINNAYQTEDAGFYMVDMTNKEGKNVRLWLSNDDKVLERRDQLTSRLRVD